MEHVINISAVDTNLGSAQDNIGVMGILAKAAAVGSTFLLDTPYLLTSLTDLENLGVTAAYDAAHGTALHQQVSEFYTEAGAGSLLWVQGMAIATAFATYVATPAFYNFIQQSAAKDPNQLIRIIGLCYNLPVARQSASDFPADVPATVTALQTIYAQMFQDGFPWSAILDGYNMSSAVTPATIGSQVTGTSFAVSICITSTLGNGVSQVGLALGRLAKIPLGRGMGNSKDGALSQVTAFLTNSIIILPTGNLTVGSPYTVAGGTVLYNGVTYQTGQTFTAVLGFTTFTTADTGYVIEGATPVQNLSPAYVKSLGQKQYLFVRTLRNKKGFYWNDGSTCIGQTSAFNRQEYDRIINDAALAVLQMWGNEYDEDLPTSVVSGDLDPGWIATKEQEFQSSYFAPLVSKGSIVAGSLEITGTKFASNPSAITFTLKIVRRTFAGDITGTVQFTPTL